MATEVKRSQIEDAVGSSRVALAADDDPQGRGIGTLLVKLEQEVEGGGGASVSNIENNGSIRWQPSLIGR